MAEIRVEPRKKGRGWLWVVLLLIVLAVILYFLYATGVFGGATTSAPVTPTSMFDDARTWLASGVSDITSPPPGGSYGTA